MSHLVFVYGTLKKGSWNHHLLEKATFLGKSVTLGKLYDLGGIPGFVRGNEDGLVHGELYRVDDETLDSLDVLEGYVKSNPGRSLYNRVIIAASYIHDEDPSVDTTLPNVFIYEINSDISFCEHIETGEW